MPLTFSHVYDASAPAGHSGTVPANSTVINASGEPVAASSWPRITHDGDGANPRALFEPACTQYVGDPADLTQWDEVGSTVTGLGADGIFQKVSLQSGGAGSHNVRQAISAPVLVGERITVSWFYDPASTLSSVSIKLIVSGGFVNIANALTGSPSLGSNVVTLVGSPKIETLRSDMVKASVVLEATTAATFIYFQFSVNTSDTALIAYLYGANLTNLPLPTSFITGASRAADTYSAASLTSRTEGLLAARFKYTGPAGQQDVLKLQNSTTGAFVALEANETAATVGGRAYDGSAEVADLAAAKTGVQTVNMAFDTDDFALSVDGAAVQSDTAGDVGALDELVIDQGSGVLELYGLTVGDTRVSDVELAAETPGAWPEGTLDLAPDAFTILWSSSEGLAAQSAVALALDQIAPVVMVTSPTLPVVTRSGVLSVDLADALIHITSPTVPSVSRTGLQSILLADVLIPVSTPVSPLLSSALPQQRDLVISDISILLDAAPKLGLDLTFPRLFAPPARAAAARPAARKKPLLPRP